MRAGPQCRIIEGVTAPTFTTAPSGARLPKRIASPPRSLCGLSRGLITSGSLFSAPAIFSPSVLSVTVGRSRLSTAGFASEFCAFFTRRQVRTISWKRYAQSLHQTVHRVSGKHTRAGAAGGTGLLLQFQEFTIIDLAGFVGANSLEDTDQVNSASI